MDANISVEISIAGDLAAVTSLLGASYPELKIGIRSRDLATRASRNDEGKPKLPGSGTYNVARLIDGLVVGCGGWSFEKPGTSQIEPNLGHIRHFAVHPRWVGRGMGRQIYRECEMQALSSGITAFEVFASLNALPFYTKLGFVNSKK